MYDMYPDYEARGVEQSSANPIKAEKVAGAIVEIVVDAMGTE